MKELILTYNYKKLYYRLTVSIIALAFLIYAYSAIQKWNLITILCCVLLVAATLFYAYSRFKSIKAIPFFLKCDQKGIYTRECFTFCSWDNIKGIELKRYMGYQTLFFEVKETNLKTKIKPITKNDVHYYCLPLADCKGKANDNYTAILNFFNNK